MADDIDLEDTVDEHYEPEMDDNEWLQSIRQDWEDYDTDLNKRASMHRIDQTPTENSVLGRRMRQKALIEMKRLTKNLCAKCGSFRDVAEYKRKGSMQYVKLCLRCAKQQKAGLLYSPFSKLAKV